jgi:hypothetical protein
MDEHGPGFRCLLSFIELVRRGEFCRPGTRAATLSHRLHGWLLIGSRFERGFEKVLEEPFG